ncbi:MAG: hypothetical protein ACKPKO_13980, partial [Candidatus Fonsibacter sp.]
HAQSDQSTAADSTADTTENNKTKTTTATTSAQNRCSGKNTAHVCCENNQPRWHPARKCSTSIINKGNCIAGLHINWTMERT